MQKKSWVQKIGLSGGAILVMTTLIPTQVLAADAPKASSMSNPTAQVLVGIICILALAIALLANVLMGAAGIYIKKYRAAAGGKKNNGVKTLMLFVWILSAQQLFAANTNILAENNSIAGLSATAFYFLISVIGLELVILLWMVWQLKLLLSREAIPEQTVSIEPVETVSRWSIWWDKINSFRPIHEEANIDLGHDYDGIRELDNRLPPWWLYGFYACILFAVIYLWRYHVVHTAPLSREELAISMEKAAIEKENYLKKAANNVNENTVTYLTDGTSLEGGKKIFMSVCAACHSADGGGMVGPNLTDDYWISGGSIADIFKTIKYGRVEKGMKSWKDDFSPLQLAQLASYIKSLHGTKPATPKEPQGILYSEVKNDSLQNETVK